MHKIDALHVVLGTIYVRESILLRAAAILDDVRIFRYNR